MSNDVVATYRHKNGTQVVEVVYDYLYCELEDANPLKREEWLSFPAAEHRNYVIGTEQLDPEAMTVRWAWAKLQAESHPDRFRMLPVYIYEHSQIAFSLGRDYPFNCPWDAGCIGAILLERGTFEGEHGLKWENARQICQGVLDEYTAYMNGWCFAYVRYELATCDRGHEHREVLDSCGGYVGLEFEQLGILFDAGITASDDHTRLHAAWEEVA
ncbi:MAG: hypothetical protein F4Z31_07700 [Gemmatimonadetes bacterium]|nr:hypothetical protein [Gemmatimonadota bacterium]